jgi:hypothetical protein
MATQGLGAGLTGFMQGAFDAMKLYMSYEQMKHNQTQDERLFELKKNLTDAQLQEIQSKLDANQKTQQYSDAIARIVNSNSLAGTPAGLKEADAESIGNTGSPVYGNTAPDAKGKAIENLIKLNAVNPTAASNLEKLLTPKENDSEFTTTISKEYVDKEGKKYYDVLVTNKKTGEVTRKTLEAGMLEDYVKNINGIGKSGATEEDLYRDLFDKAFKYSAKEVGLDNQNFDFSTLKDEKLQNKILFYLDATTPEKFKPYVINRYIQTLIDNGITKPVVKRGTDGNDYTVVNVGGRDYIVTKEK